MYDETDEGPQECHEGCGYAAGDDGYCSDECAIRHAERAAEVASGIPREYAEN
jgi:hypothetical protein